MQSIQRISAACLFGLTISFSTTAVCSLSSQEVGLPCSDSELHAIVGLDCGQFGTTQGQSDCSQPNEQCSVRAAGWSDGVAGGTICTSATCGSCTGGRNQWCAGAVVMNNSYCNFNTAPCCFQPKACTTVFGATPAGIPFARCDCAGPAVPPMAAVGTRTIATVYYSACETIDECCAQ